MRVRYEGYQKKTATRYILWRKGYTDEELANHGSVSKESIKAWRNNHNLKKNYKWVEIHLSDIERGFVAGCLDCDGCIVLTKDKDEYIHPRVSFSNTNPNLLTRLKEIIGNDNSFFKEPQSGKFGKTPVLRLSVLRMDFIRSLLNQIIPILIIKNKKAELVRDFCDARIKEIERGNFHGGYSSLLYSIFQEFKSLGD